MNQIDPNSLKSKYGGLGMGCYVSCQHIEKLNTTNKDILMSDCVYECIETMNRKKKYYYLLGDIDGDLKKKEKKEKEGNKTHEKYF